MIANLQTIRFTNLNFFASVTRLENVELKIDVNHNVQNISDDPLQKKVVTKILIYPENEAALDGGFGVKVEAEAFIVLDTLGTDKQIHAETAKVVFPYLRAAIANMMTIAEFPPFHIPFFELTVEL